MLGFLDRLLAGLVPDGFRLARNGLLSLPLARILVDEFDATYFDVPPRDIGVASIAYRSVSAVVGVDVTVTSTASCVLTDLCYWGHMAIDALQTCMPILQLEAGLVVIKVPIPPIAGVVTSFAVDAEAAHVYIFFLMAGTAIGFGVLERDCNVTFAARD